MATKYIIPGWTRIAPQQASDTEGAQVVNGWWYVPRLGMFSLQECMDDWFDYWRSTWLANSYVVDGRRRGTSSRDAQDAEAILRDWSMLDGDGQLVPIPTERGPSSGMAQYAQFSDMGITDDNLQLIVDESGRQIEKWGIQHRSPFEWLAFLTEEAGELADAISEWYFRDGSVEDITREAIQTATLALKIAIMAGDHGGKGDTHHE